MIQGQRPPLGSSDWQGGGLVAEDEKREMTRAHLNMERKEEHNAKVDIVGGELGYWFGYRDHPARTGTEYSSGSPLRTRYLLHQNRIPRYVLTIPMPSILNFSWYPSPISSCVLVDRCLSICVLIDLEIWVNLPESTCMAYSLWER